MYSSQEVRYIVIEVLDGMVENIQEHASSLDSYTETLLAWPPTQIATKEELLWCRMLSAPIRGLHQAQRATTSFSSALSGPP